MKRKVFLTFTVLLQEVGHRYLWRPKEQKFRCSWCGARLPKKVMENRARWGHAARICIDRQAMLFSSINKSTEQNSLGWTPVAAWNCRFKS